jgi:uncharacterized protein YdeI (YjbR/CyaY-like superfamily)
MELIQPATRRELRKWLERNHDRPEGVWIASYKKASGKAGPTYDDIVEELIAFGWVDSKSRSVDDERTSLWASPRRPRSAWSASNVARVEKLERAGLMTGPGLAAVDEAKRSGRWPTG